MPADPPFIPCSVIVYSGHRGDERPSTITVEGGTVEIVRIRSLRIEEDLHTRARKRFFEALGSDGMKYVLLHDTALDRWFLRRHI